MNRHVNMLPTEKKESTVGKGVNCKVLGKMMTMMVEREKYEKKKLLGGFSLYNVIKYEVTFIRPTFI